MRRIDNEYYRLPLEPPASRFLGFAEAAANEFVAPVVSAILPIIGGGLLGLAVLAAEMTTGREPDLRLLVAGATIGLGIAGMRLLGVFDALGRMLDTLHAARLDVDTDQDGIEDEEEVETALGLFTEEGIAMFVREVIFRRKDWKSRSLIPHVLSREEYDVVIGDILPTIGILGEAKKNQTRPLLVTDEAQAMRTIKDYFQRPRRRVWTFTIGNRRIVL